MRPRDQDLVRFLVEEGDVVWRAVRLVLIRLLAHGALNRPQLDCVVGGARD